MITALWFSEICKFLCTLPNKGHSKLCLISIWNTLCLYILSANCLECYFIWLALLYDSIHHNQYHYASKIIICTHTHSINRHTMGYTATDFKTAKLQMTNPIPRKSSVQTAQWISVSINTWCFLYWKSYCAWLYFCIPYTLTFD